MGWDDRNCFQKFLLLLKIFALLCIVAAFVMNLTTAIKAAQEKWFEAPQCKNCGAKEAAFFYIMRIYSMVFCIIIGLAEYRGFEWFHDGIKVLRYYWGRGFLQVFVGFLTVTGDVAPDSSTTTLVASIIGYVLMGCGGLHFLLSLLCFKEYSTQGRDAQNYEPAPTDPRAGPNKL